MKKIIFTCLLVLLQTSSCKKDFAPLSENRPDIILSVEDVGVTEVWLKLTIQNPKSEIQISLTRNDSLIHELNASHLLLQNPQSDTLLYDSGLLPNHDYTYTATLTTDNQKPVTRSRQLTTMDTTSHDFTWDIITYNSSRLNDVAIINNNEIWCVGEIYTDDTYTYDSLGNWIDPYNAVHWNGNKWDLKRILFDLNGNQMWSPIKSVFAFSKDDVWFEAGIHWNGQIFETIPFNISFNSHANKMWGTSSDDLYIVGNDGLLAHYNGHTWKRIENGINIRINDIFGVYNKLRFNKYIICTASDLFDDNDEIIFRIKEDNSLEQINLPVRNPYPLIKPYSIWFKDPKKIFLAGNGLFERDCYGNWKERTDIPSNWFKTSIRGTDLNNIFVSQHGGDISHFNGVSWKSYSFAENGVLEAVAVTEDLVVAVGSNASEALLIIGRNNN